MVKSLNKLSELQLRRSYEEMTSNLGYLKGAYDASLNRSNGF